ncbi:MAG: hypothetical protein ABSD09_15350 [Xanthobacteraceae bacterium]
MHDDDNRFQRIVPLLRRVIILLAVLAATPVVLWMITTFVRAYVGPPRIPAPHQIAATTPTVSATAAASTPNSDQAAASPAQSKIADVSASTTDVTATTSDPRDVASPKGSLLAERPSDGAAAAPASTSTMATASIPPPSQAPAAFATPTNLTGAMTPTGGAPQIPQLPPANTASAEASPTATEQSPDVMPPAPPLTGKIPLPRHRPRGLGEANTQLAQGAVPVPRPRPDAAGPASAPDAASPGPLDFLQNIFHQ